VSYDLAVIGLGQMGGRSAALAVAEGLSVVAYDPMHEAGERAGAAGVKVVSSAEEAASSAGTVLVSVPRPDQVSDLAANALHQAGAGTVVVDISTIDPGTARRAAASLSQHDVTYVDAPVLGRPDKCGLWTLVVGGSSDTVEAVTPLLMKTVAARVVWVGDVGAGSVVKLLNNLMFGAINSVTAEALTLCRLNDVDPALFVDAVAQSGAATVSNLFKEIAPRMISGDDEPAFSLALLAKDNRLALELARSSNSPAPVARAVDRINQAAMAQGLGDRDTGVVHRAYPTLSDEAAG
jgi:3-hydroxyisobutyrate dehydrogenase